MNWYQTEDDEEEDLMYSPALMARRASESWIDTPPVEVLPEEQFSSCLFTLLSAMAIWYLVTLLLISY